VRFGLKEMFANFEFGCRSSALLRGKLFGIKEQDGDAVVEGELTLNAQIAKKQELAFYHFASELSDQCDVMSEQPTRGDRIDRAKSLCDECVQTNEENSNKLQETLACFDFSIFECHDNNIDNDSESEAELERIGERSLPDNDPPQLTATEIEEQHH
jgi:hypothetical protein